MPKHIKTISKPRQNHKKNHLKPYQNHLKPNLRKVLRQVSGYMTDGTLRNGKGLEHHFPRARNLDLQGGVLLSRQVEPAGSIDFFSEKTLDFRHFQSLQSHWRWWLNLIWCDWRCDRLILIIKRWPRVGLGLALGWPWIQILDRWNSLKTWKAMVMICDHRWPLRRTRPCLANLVNSPEIFLHLSDLKRSQSDHRFGLFRFFGCWFQHSTESTALKLGTVRTKASQASISVISHSRRASTFLYLYIPIIIPIHITKAKGLAKLISWFGERSEYGGGRRCPGGPKSRNWLVLRVFVFWIFLRGHVPLCTTRQCGDGRLRFALGSLKMEGKR